MDNNIINMEKIEDSSSDEISASNEFEFENEPFDKSYFGNSEIANK